MAPAANAQLFLRFPSGRGRARQGRQTLPRGGASQLAGSRELSGRILNKQVRLGKPQNLSGLPESSAGPDYASVVGLAMAGALMPPELLNPEISGSSQELATKGWISRLTSSLFG